MKNDQQQLEETLELSIVMPCLNEAETLADCIQKAQQALKKNGIVGEVIAADNGSTDGSQTIASERGARVVHILEKGYGNALAGGIRAARGRYVIMGDADSSYDFTSLMTFVVKLREGWDLVMGNRFLGCIKAGAMPPLHRFLGNPVLTGIGRLLFRSPVGDFHCGLRGFSKKAFERMDLQTTGMEFASEMVVKASLLRMRITEVPVTLSPDGRSRPPHLRSWHDGWRHLRFMLLYSPRWLFLYPGFFLMLVGGLTTFWLLPSPRPVGAFVLDVHTLLYAAMAVLIGFQSVAFSVFSRVFATSAGLLPESPVLNRFFRYATLEVGLIAGCLLVFLGLGGAFCAVFRWGESSFGPLEPARMLRMVIPSVLTLVLGCQVILSSFMLSVLGLRRKGSKLE